MNKKVFLILLLFVGMCNALSAQNLVTKKDYYDSWQFYIKNKWTVLPDGTAHGKAYFYREDGTINSITDWNYGEIVGKTYYYYDGKTPAYKWSGEVQFSGEKDGYYVGHTSVSYSFYQNFIKYDDNGKAMLQSTITQRKGDTCYYTIRYDRDIIYFEDDYHVYFKEGSTSYSSNGKIATFNSDNLCYTYDFKKEQINIINYTGKISNINLVIKNGMAEYNATDDSELKIDGYVYLIKKGTSDKFKYDPIPLNKREFGKIFNIRSFSDDWFDNGAYLAVSYPAVEISLPSKYVKNKFKDSRIGIGIKYLDHEYPKTLKLVSGTFENGVLESECNTYSNTYSIETKDGQIVLFKDKDKNGKIMNEMTVVASTYNTEGNFYHLRPVEGTKISQGYNKNREWEEWKMIGKFDEYGDFLEGTKIKNDLKTIEKGIFEKGILIDGNRTYIGNYGTKKEEGVFEDGEIIKGSITKNYNDSTIEVWSFENGIQDPSATHTFTDKNGNKIVSCGTLRHSDFSGELMIGTGTLTIFYPDSTKQILEGTFEDIKFVEWITTYEWRNHYMLSFKSGKFIDVTGNTYTTNGKFNDFFIYDYRKVATVIAKPCFNISYEGTIHVDVATEYGRYIGDMYKDSYGWNRANGQGKLILTNGNEWSGNFKDSNLSFSSISTVTINGTKGEVFKGQMQYGVINGQGTLTLPNGDYYIGEFIKGKFSGTGTVRYTHKSGVFEGKVVNFECQYDTPQEAKALKKVPAPKMPKAKFPSWIGKIIYSK